MVRAQTPAAAPAHETLSIGPLADGLGAIWANLAARSAGEIALAAFLSLTVALGASVIVLLLRRAFNAASSALAGDERGQAGARQQAPARVGLASLRFARVAVWLGALLLILRIWGVDLVALTDGLLAPLVGAAGRIALILAIAFAALEFAGAAVNKTIERAAERAREPRRAAQMRTIKPVLRAAISVTIVVLAGLTVLSELGIDVGPMLAGAGLVGLAVGFGAQSIVKDLITGLFLIVEDIVSIGDVAEINAMSGVVESMTLRTIRLRALDGTLAVIPYGEAQIIQNMSKDFSYYVFDVAIAPSADVMAALEAIRRTGAALRAQAPFGAFMLEDIDVLGVDSLADGAVKLKARIKTAPGKQWALGREFLMRVKTAFDDAGIDLVPTRVQITSAETPAEGRGRDAASRA